MVAMAANAKAGGLFLVSLRRRRTFQLEGKIHYGLAKDQIRKDVDTWHDEQRW